MHRFAAVIAGFLAGCSSIVPGTALRLGTVDPLTADPGQISVAIELSEGLAVLPGSVKLSLSAEHPERGAVGGDWTLEGTEQSGERWLFRMPEAELADVRRVQREIKSWKTADPDGTEGALSVSLGGCRTAPDADIEDARASVFVAFSSDGPLLPLFRDAPVAEVLSADQMSRLPPCI